VAGYLLMAITVAIDRMSECSALIFVSSAMIYTDDQICENEVPNAGADLRGHRRILASSGDLTAFLEVLQMEVSDAVLIWPDGPNMNFFLGWRRVVEV
jgi:hypothetical protein